MGPSFYCSNAYLYQYTKICQTTELQSDLSVAGAYHIVFFSYVHRSGNIWQGALFITSIVKHLTDIIIYELPTLRAILQYIKKCLGLIILEKLSEK